MRALGYIFMFGLLTGCQLRRAPLVDILAPANGMVYRTGDIVKVQAELSDADILLGEYLTIVTGNGYSDTILKFEDHAQQGSYTLSKQFLLQSPDTFKIIVQAYGGSSITVTKEAVIYAQ